MLPLRGAVDNPDLRDKNWVVAERGKDGLVDFVVRRLKLLAEIAGAEKALERRRGSGRVVTAQDGILVDKEADATAEAMLGGGVVIEELGASFILPDLHVAVVRGDRDETVVAKLVKVSGLGTPRFVDGQHGLGVS